MREHPDVEHRPLKEDLNTALELLKKWYEKRQGSYPDFGYTLFLMTHMEDFPELEGFVVYVNGEPKAFSLWGRMDDEYAIHIACKDLGLPFLQDYTRHVTYSDMLKMGFKYVNDGGDCGLDGLRVYKSKLRPRFIIPIYSLVRK
jgi:hypothetical protein